MNVKFAVAAVAACLVVTACGVGPNMQGFSLGGSQKDVKSAQDPNARFKILTELPDCPECCVAITGTSNNAYEVTVGDETYNIEINTPAGRVNFVTTQGNEPSITEQFPIIEARCYRGEDGVGPIIGAEVDIDTDGNLSTVEATFIITGTNQGNSHIAVDTVDVEVFGDVPFEDFGPTENRTGQNVFPDTDCDGTPNPPLSNFPE